MKVKTEKEEKSLPEMQEKLTPWQQVALARDAGRPGVVDYIAHLFTDFFEQRGDRCGGEDSAILGGIARFHGIPVTVLGHRKGKNLDENLTCRFGMPSPEGYRKAQRLMEQAERFHRPVITFVDTPGAYPGKEAEQHGQGEAIARCIASMSGLTVPVLTVVTGEGGSGGALALAVAGEIWMLEYAVFSIASPEGFASILWKDASRAQEACEVMKLTAQDLLRLGIIDRIVDEPVGDWGRSQTLVMNELRRQLQSTLKRLAGLSPSQLVEKRYDKYRRIGSTAYGK